jgi:ribulose-5-phosphate 4-epimerase/fuculose-1-phosphate aldolase
VVRQETPTVTDPQPVIEALKAGNLVVLKNHGTVAMGEDFEAALSLTEALEEAVLVAAVARLFKQGPPAPAGAPAQDGVSRTEPAYPMFSREHVEAIVELVNKEPVHRPERTGTRLTVKLAIRLGPGRARV